MLEVHDEICLKDTNSCNLQVALFEMPRKSSEVMECCRLANASQTSSALDREIVSDNS